MRLCALWIGCVGFALLAGGCVTTNPPGQAGMTQKQVDRMNRMNWLGWIPGVGGAMVAADAMDMQNDMRNGISPMVSPTPQQVAQPASASQSMMTSQDIEAKQRELEQYKQYLKSQGR